MDIGKRPGAFTGIDTLKKEEAMLENIVDYLTDGYWESTGSTRRKFDVQPGGTLTVNITALTTGRAATCPLGTGGMDQRDRNPVSGSQP